ncbi:MAG: DUF3761 domain-containing protein, partial [Bacteroidales bacterium]|nr:DUF3761 domain-containing protein [Bacteroidales bacterium]
VIPKGTTVKIDKDCDCKWILIDYQGKIGYVNSSYLKIPKKQVVKAATQKPVKYYTNSEGIRVQSPTYYSQPPVGATARCRDGTYSFSRNRRGTCSHHGGVAQWLR